MNCLYHSDETLLRHKKLKHNLLALIFVRLKISTFRGYKFGTNFIFENNINNIFANMSL